MNGESEKRCERSRQEVQGCLFYRKVMVGKQNSARRRAQVFKAREVGRRGRLGKAADFFFLVQLFACQNVGLAAGGEATLLGTYPLALQVPE